MTSRRLNIAALFVLLVVTAVACSSSSNATATRSAAPEIGRGTAASVPATTPRTATPAGSPIVARPQPKNKTLLLATTTSTQDSGLLDVLIPLFQQQSGYEVKTAAVGSGEALKRGELGEADVLLVHSPAAEQAFMAKDQGINRRLVMHNDFIVVGPASDPARLQGTASAVATLQKLSAAKAPFISRGDNSGTNALELQLWKKSGIDPKGQGWYIETGQGMGATLQIAAEKDGYTISDRATYLATQKQTNLALLVEKDPSLLNVYHVIQVNPANHTELNVAAAQAFADFMVAPATQGVIAAFGREKYGQALFVADAGKSDDQVLPPNPGG